MRRTTLALTAAATTAAVGLGAWQLPRLLGDDDGDRRAAQSFAAAWTGGTLTDLPWAPGAGEPPAEQVADLTAGLDPRPDDRPAEVRVGQVRRDGDRATAGLDVRWDLGTPWQYATTLPLRRRDDVWRPVFAPSVVHPSLEQAGQVLRARSVQPPRAPITDRRGTPLVRARPVVTVGLQPSRAADLAATVRRVAALTDVDQAPLLERARAASPDAFVEVVTLRREAYEARRAQLRPVPGVVLREGERQLAPTAAFARALLGSVGPATAELVAQGGGRVRADQQVGLSGLQRTHDEQLGGTPGLVVERTGAGAAQVLQQTPASPGTALRVTLDAEVQQAADTAVAAAPEGKAAALVAVRVSTGEVLAVANDGPQGPTVDRALTGRFPPGSTFKTASTLALLRQGLRPSDVVPCPATVSVQGKRFSNAEDEVLGDQPFSTDFARSCNTAFVGSAGRITSAQLTRAAEDLGHGTGDLGVGAFGGEVPTTSDPVEHAAQTIGQGRVLASPLSAAVAAATVAGGRLRPPRLLVDRPAEAPGPPLPQAPALQALTRLVVTSGTATVLRDAPGPPVSGKTGTAEFGTRTPPQTHAWFAGAAGDVAVAVLVEDGGFGGQVAAPVARTFLAGLTA